MKFNDLNLHSHLLKAVEKQGFTIPTPVQQQAIPPITEGKDVMACAQTGTGKTAAFVLPSLSKLLENPRNNKSNAPRFLVLTPTRELADQVLSNIVDFIRSSDLRAGLVVGGVSYNPQIKMLRNKLDILVATPGRLIDHMDEGFADLSKVEIFVLDEADRMLDMGFSKAVDRLVAKMPKQRQTLLFSATFDNEIEQLAKKFLKEPVQVKLAAATERHENIKQSVFYTSSKDHKIELLKTILEDQKVWQAIIFMRTKHAADRMAKNIANWGQYRTDALHGDMRQSARKRVIDAMYRGKIRVLVATDVAARGLDVKDLTHVINFDLPQVPDDYIHRIGRTGRAGAEGTAISFVSADENHLWKGIEKLLGHKIEAKNEAHVGKALGDKVKKKPSRGKGGFKKKSFGGNKEFNGNRKKSNSNSDSSNGNVKKFAGKPKNKFGGNSNKPGGKPKRSPQRAHA